MEVLEEIVFRINCSMNMDKAMDITKYHRMIIKINALPENHENLLISLLSELLSKRHK